MPPHHVILNNLEKLEVLEEYKRIQENGDNVSLIELANWTKEKFRLQKLPSKATISRIIKNETKVRNDVDNQKFKSIRGTTVKIPEFEKLLVEWLWTMYDENICVTDGLIREKAKRILDNLNENRAENERMEMNLSNGWLYKFKNRNSFKRYRLFGESGDVNIEGIISDLPKLRKKISEYSINDVFNADEFGLFYKLAPDSSIGPSRIAGRKKKKERLTLLACVNGDGTEKMPLLFIGKSKMPKCFNGMTGDKLGFDYHFNSKSWMNTGIFFEWLKAFDSYIGETRNRKALLIIDNASCHGTSENLPNFLNIEIMFLPPKTTSQLQPLDSGIIAALKSHYRRRQISMALDRSEKESKSIYDIDQLTAMKWMKENWESLKEEIVFNCWFNTGLIATTNSVLKNSELEASSEIREIKSLLLNKLPMQFHKTINEMIILDE